MLEMKWKFHSPPDIYHEYIIFCSRDLMKWCSRIAFDFDIAHASTSSVVFQEALDCFCACLSKPDKRLPLAEAMGAKLNITKVKVSLTKFVKESLL